MQPHVQASCSQGAPWWYKQASPPWPAKHEVNLKHALTPATLLVFRRESESRLTGTSTRDKHSALFIACQSQRVRLHSEDSQYTKIKAGTPGFFVPSYPASRHTRSFLLCNGG
jgi:hypothetical protein